MNTPASPAAYQNTDKEIWRKRPGDFYSPSIFVNEKGDIGINVGGFVIVSPVETWHKPTFGTVGELNRELNAQLIISTASPRSKPTARNLISQVTVDERRCDSS
mgnify:CR=1 FL=1